MEEEKDEMLGSKGEEWQTGAVDVWQEVREEEVEGE